MSRFFVRKNKMMSDMVLWNNKVVVYCKTDFWKLNYVILYNYIMLTTLALYRLPSHLGKTIEK